MDRQSVRRAATPVTFIVRLFPDDDARVTGIVERVRTGEKERFYGVGAIGPLIAQMLSGDAGHAETDPSPPREEA